MCVASVDPLTRSASSAPDLAKVRSHPLAPAVAAIVGPGRNPGRSQILDLCPVCKPPACATLDRPLAHQTHHEHTGSHPSPLGGRHGLCRGGLPGGVTGGPQGARRGRPTVRTISSRIGPPRSRRSVPGHRPRARALARRYSGTGTRTPNSCSRGTRVANYTIPDRAPRIVNRSPSHRRARPGPAERP